VECCSERGRKQCRWSPLPRGPIPPSSIILPFAASTSIWNTPIGSKAQYTPANIYPPRPSNFSQCGAGWDDPSSRETCPGIKGGVTPTECAAAGCCFEASPTPDPKHYPWCWSKTHRAGPIQFHNDQEYFVQVCILYPRSPAIHNILPPYHTPALPTARTPPPVNAHIKARRVHASNVLVHFVRIGMF
jgi:hypothetical protein